MKKLVIIIATLSFGMHGIAQDKYVISAASALNSNLIDEAKEDIDKAVTNPETSEKPKTLLVKGEVYMRLQGEEKYKASNPYKEAAQALLKLTDVKPDYEKDKVYQYLMMAMGLYYNDGVKAYNDKKYPEALEDMKLALRIHSIDPGKKVTDQIPDPIKKRFDTAAADANQIIANCTYYDGHYDQAIPLLVAVKNNPITRTASVYSTLVEAYNQQKNTTEAMNTIQEGRKFFPDDPVLRGDELNYVISSGQNDEVLKKLQEAAASDPKNGDFQFDIGVFYVKKARPKSGPKPDNAAEMYAKADEAFKRALAIDPNNGLYNFDYGSMFFNQAVDLNTQMNDITGTTDADQKKYDDLKAQRDAMFAKSTPYFEAAYNGYVAKEKTLTDEEKDTYRQTVQSLKILYARQGKTDKSEEMKKKLETM